MTWWCREITLELFQRYTSNGFRWHSVPSNTLHCTLSLYLSLPFSSSSQGFLPSLAHSLFVSLYQSSPFSFIVSLLPLRLSFSPPSLLLHFLPSSTPTRCVSSLIPSNIPTQNFFPSPNRALGKRILWLLCENIVIIPMEKSSVDSYACPLEVLCRFLWIMYIISIK